MPKKPDLSALRPLGIFLFVFGCKLWLIRACASPCPYWDEWDVEARGLFKPLIEGNLSWINLFSPHNEHRLFMTRLLSLLLFKLNGLWEPKLAMVAGALIHSATAVLFYSWFRKVFAGKFIEWLWTALILAVFALPLAFENPLMGLQTQVYFVILFSALSVKWLSQNEPFDLKWTLGAIFSILAYFSLASGILAAAAGLAVIASRSVIAQNFNRRRAGGIFILLAIFAAGYFFTPVMGGGDAYKASSVPLFLGALLNMLSPPSFADLWTSALVWLPFFTYLFYLFLQKSDPSPEDRFLLGWGFLVLLHAAALAYGRGNSLIVTGRYFDFFLPGLLVNLIAVVKLLKAEFPVSHKKISMFAAFWIWIIVCGFWNQTLHQLANGIKTKREEGQMHAANVKAYLSTGDFAYLKDKPEGQIPYASKSAGELRELLDDPSIQSFLPEGIRPDGRKGRMMFAAEAVLKNWIEFTRMGLILLLFPFFYGIFRFNE